MTIPQLNAEIRRLEPLSTELWNAHKAIAKPSLDAWLAVAEKIDRLKAQRVELIEQITSDTVTATV